MLDTNSVSAGGTASAANDTPFASLRKAHFPGLRFKKGSLTQAGRILKEQGEEAAVAFLDGKGEIDPYNARPPAKCQIVAQSRPFSEWPIAIVSRNVQQAVYKLRLEDYELLKAGFTKTHSGREFILHRLRVAGQNLHAQALNLIIPHALDTYGGVLVKVANHNEKKASKHQKANERRRDQGFDLEEAPAAKVATDAEGYLLEPPGVNPCITCYQTVSPRPVLHTKGMDGVPERWAAYARDPDAPLRASAKLDRLSIPPGMPGHVPAWQHPLLSRKKGRRNRAWYANALNKPKRGRRPESPARALARERARDEGALLIKISIGDDWVLLDARGLLRNVVYRGLAKEGLSLRGLLAMFSGDPVIDPIRGVATFMYKEGLVPIRKRNTTTTKKAPDLLRKMVEDHGTIGMVSIDLGQTNPIAARVSRLSGNLVPEFVSQLALTDELKNAWARYRSDSDQLEERLLREAVDSLAEAQRDENTRVTGYCPADAKRLLTERFDVDLSDLPWELMTSGTYHIADRIIRERPSEPDLVHFLNQKKGVLKRTDFNVYRWTRPTLAKETREALNSALWTLKRKSPEYARLAHRKRELARRCANWVVREGRRLTRCDIVVVNVEDLNVRFFHGSGKRDVGWDQFFVRKKENRWLIQALHRALTDLAPHQGISVIESNPARTSITCPLCGTCDRKSRDGEDFCCVNCSAKLHADFEVATRNLERVALTGQAMPKGERQGAPEKPRTARKPRSPRKRSGNASRETDRQPRNAI